MANLLWKTADSTRGLLATPFKTEDAFEEFIFSTPEILEDIFLITRQIRGGNKPGIPDIIGIDKDGNVCIVELKNVEVDASIIPQVLTYAIWAETNPDSIKSLWLEWESKPEDLSISWDNLQVRIIVIAPNILKSTLDAVNKINYHVDLIEVKRWVEGENQLLLVNTLEEERRSRVTTVKGRPEYNEQFYQTEYNKQSAKAFLQYAREVESIIKENGWSLETKFNKHYVGFKSGFFNAFGIQWIGTKTFAFFFKLAKEKAEEVPIDMTRYEAQWKQALYYIEPGKTKTTGFLPLFELAYKRLTGE